MPLLPDYQGQLVTVAHYDVVLDTTYDSLEFLRVLIEVPNEQ